MSRKMNPLLKHSITLALCSGGLIASPFALAFNCGVSMSLANWDSTGSWINCNSSTPAAGDNVDIPQSSTLKLNGTTTPAVGTVILPLVIRC